MGVTDPVEVRRRVDPRRLRLEIGQNLVHGSDSPESAEREIDIFFPGL